MDISDHFASIKNILDKLDIENINWNNYIKNKSDIVSLNDLKNIELSNSIGLSYKYLKTKLLVLVIHSDEFCYILTHKKLNLIEALNIILEKVDTAFVLNCKHIYKFNNSSKLIDTQILLHLLMSIKDGELEFNSEYSDKINTFINNVYKNHEYYFCIPTTILLKSMLNEAICAYTLGKTLREISIKLNMNKLIIRMHKLSELISFIEDNNIIINLKLLKSYAKSGLIKSQYLALANYLIKNKTNKIPIKYKFLRSKTGRIIFDNGLGFSIITLPQSELRKIIIPEFDKFVSLDIKAAEVFYVLKNNTSFFDTITIDNDFDLYDYIRIVCCLDSKRNIIKDILIKWLYGSLLKDDETNIIQSILEKIPELKKYHTNQIPEYWQTKFGRILNIEKSYTKFYNNIPQSEFADEMIDILLELQQNLSIYNLRSKIKFIIYDEIILDVPGDEVDVVKEIFENCVKNKFPYRVTEGLNWFEVNKK